MRRILMVVAVAVLGAACGGGGGGKDTSALHTKPVIELVSPLEGSTLTGAATITVKATGDGVDMKALVFTSPSGFSGALASFDAGTHTGTLSMDINSKDYPDGVLSVGVKATDLDNRESTASFSFLVSSTPRPLTIDGNYLSFFDEAGVQLGQSGGVAVVPAQYVYASADKVAVVDGATIHKIASRMAWVGATPSAADLDANAYNLPVMRLLAPHSATDPAITTAKALVTVGTGSAVTVDLIADATSPSGQQAYLLPLASNLFSDLGGITVATDIKVSAVVKDALNHSSTGGPWTVQLTPLAPPVIAVVDTLYSSAADARSAYPYTGANYATLWTSPASTWALDGGVRVYHVVVTNPAGDPVSVGAALGGAKSWSISESWSPFTVSTATWGTCTYSCSGSGGSGSPSCSTSCTRNPPRTCTDTGTGKTYSYQAAGSSSWSCVDSATVAGPTSTSLSQSGTLKVSAFKAGTTSVADKSGDRWLVPAASGSNPGRLDFYVVRPATTGRGSAPALTWASSQFATDAQFTYVNNCIFGGYTSSSCTEQQISRGLHLGTPTESISGTIALDVQAYAGTSGEYGPVAPALSAKTLPATITH